MMAYDNSMAELRDEAAPDGYRDPRFRSSLPHQTRDCGEPSAKNGISEPRVKD